MEQIFYLKRENDVCSAIATSVPHPYHQMYHLKFEDGYENIFFTDPETGSWMEEDLGETALAASFGMKVYLAYGAPKITTKHLAWCKATVADDILHFGFYVNQQDKETLFEVYGSNRKFLYALRNTQGRWRVYGPHLLLQPQQYTGQVKIIISIFKGLSGNA